MYNVLLVTGSRAEYGIMSKLIKRLANDSEINFKLVATAMHLEEKYGNTYQEIENDGIEIAYKIPMNLVDTSNKTILNGMSILQDALAEILENEKFDLCIILGDRYEMLSVVNACVINRIPICHLHGGEKTLGNYDEFIRHAITKMSHLHLTATTEFSNRVKQLGEQQVHNIGSLGVNNVLQDQKFTKDELASRLGVDLSNKYFVVLFHPVTLQGEADLIRQTADLLKVLDEKADEYDFIFIGSNSDTGSDEIAKQISGFLKKHPHCSNFKSLNVQEYHSLILHSLGLIGNSSSGLIEVPSLQKYTLNIGDRQKGRVRGTSVIDVADDYNSIKQGVNLLIDKLADQTKIINPYFQENSLEMAINIIKNALKDGITIEKDFNDLELKWML
ncbi:MAG: UDP-N-acetylglucosamine 2-epimerase [Mycoplasmatales bacterium]